MLEKIYILEQFKHLPTLLTNIYIIFYFKQVNKIKFAILINCAFYEVTLIT